MTIMTEEWVSFWYQCLDANLDYRKYCQFRDENNIEKCQALERTFPKVREIYEDFRDVGIWSSDGLKSKDWIAWIDNKRDLFGIPGFVTRPSTFTPHEGYALLEVPLMGSALETTALVGKFLTHYYATTDVNAAPEPKYMLFETNGRVSLTYQTVRNACLVGSLTARFDHSDPENIEELSYKQAVTAFMRREIETLGWGKRMDSDARKKLIEEGKLSEDDFATLSRMVNKSRQLFRALARNTIEGRFPDATPFDISSAEDNFL